MGAGKNAPLSGEPIVRMMESKGVCDMKKPRYYITLNSEETRLIRMKNRLIQEGRYTDCVDELIAKIAAK